ncbi:restriction endonuclease subunit S [Paraprevotella clara]|uniref:restriction endonuclease subunit S n=2 Tax=Paraprevotella clara TaxID=454154 RepID=UPI00248BD537|nr:restriction endonuclease subunit S [Paraprevotella clara]
MNGKQLKNSILQWAIQGKLVSQDPNDEPASVLLERIRAEKAKLVKEKKIKKDKNESIIYRGDDNSYYEKFIATGEVKCIDEEIPFEIPSSWEWCRMQDIMKFVNGRAYKKEELLSRGKYKVLRVGNFFTNNEWYYSDLELPDDKYCYPGDLLYAWSASFGPQIWNDVKTIFHYHIWNVKYNSRILLRDYLFYFFLYDKTQVLSSTTGSTMIHVSMENMKPRFIPIPPYCEQKRIVSKINELLPVIDKFDDVQKELDTLNALIKESLKKSILQEAIQGKLVPQITEEGTAQELLEQIRQEKLQLVKDGKLKKSALTDSIIFKGDDNKYYEQVSNENTDITEEIPFDLPNNWTWIRFGQYVRMSIGKTPPRGETKYWTNGIYPWVSISDMSDYGLVKTTKETVSEYVQSLFGDISSAGTLIMSFKLTVGRTSILDISAYHNEAVISIYPFVDKDYRTRNYLFYILPIISNLGDSKDAIKGKTLNSKSLNNLLLPLPPLNEQGRIVAIIEQLFDKLR